MTGRNTDDNWNVRILWYVLYIFSDGEQECDSIYSLRWSHFDPRLVSHVVVNK